MNIVSHKKSRLWIIISSLLLIAFLNLTSVFPYFCNVLKRRNYNVITQPFTDFIGIKHKWYIYSKRIMHYLYYELSVRLNFSFERIRFNQFKYLSIGRRYRAFGADIIRCMDHFHWISKTNAGQLEEERAINPCSSKEKTKQEIWGVSHQMSLKFSYCTILL